MKDDEPNMGDPTVPDLILSNANVITLDPAHPQAEVVAIHSGRILGIGQNWELEKSRELFLINRHQTMMPIVMPRLSRRGEFTYMVHS